MKTGILLVSFGSTHPDTLEKTIAKAERDVAAAFPACGVYRAFTSGVVRKRLREQFDIRVDSVDEALAKMERDGAELAIVQPTLLIAGEENDLLRRQVLSNRGRLTIRIGLPLLWDDGDLRAVLEILQAEYPEEADTVRVAMGHGTAHPAGEIYPRFARMMAGSGAMALCTVEGTPTFDDVLRELLAQPRRKVLLFPLLLVAGDHAKHDMAGEEDSLKRLLEENGFTVRCAVRGLGEIAAIRARYLARVRAAMERT